MCQQYYLTGLEAIRAGDLAYGESMANDALSFLDQIFGTVHPELAGKHHHLAKVFATIAQNTLPRIQLYEQSKRITDETEMQKIRETAELSTDEDCATLNNQVQGIIQSATSMFRHSLVLTERTSGPLSFPTALRMQKLGAHEGNHGDVGLGIELVRRALSILRIIYGEDHHLAASWTLNLASMVAKHSGHTASIPFFEEAVRLVLNTEGPESDSAAVAFTSLAQMQFLAGHVDAALVTSRKAEEAFKAAFGAEDARTNDAHQLTAHIELVQQHKAQGEQAKVERLAKRLGVKEDRAKHLLERSLRSETGTASTTASTSSVTTEDSSVSNLPLDDIVNFVTGGARASSSSSASGKTSRRSGPKGKGPARRKK